MAPTNNFTCVAWEEVGWTVSASSAKPFLEGPPAAVTLENSWCTKRSCAPSVLNNPLQNNGNKENPSRYSHKGPLDGMAYSHAGRTGLTASESMDHTLRRDTCPPKQAGGSSLKRILTSSRRNDTKRVTWREIARDTWLAEGRIGNYEQRGGLNARSARYTEDTGCSKVGSKAEINHPSNTSPHIFANPQDRDRPFWPHLQRKTNQARAWNLSHPHIPTPFNTSRQSIPTTPSININHNSILSPFTKPFNPNLIHFKHWDMEAMNEEDKRLIAKFVGLCTQDQLPMVQVPQNVTISNAWDLSLLAKIMTDRIVMDAPFASNMIKAWAVEPATVIRPVTKNCYLIEFTNTDDLYRASLGGPWTYWGDLVATRRVSSHGDLTLKHIGFSHLWVQLYNLPLNSLTDEGIQIIARPLGTSVTPRWRVLSTGSILQRSKSWPL